MFTHAMVTWIVSSNHKQRRCTLFQERKHRGVGGTGTERVKLAEPLSLSRLPSYKVFGPQVKVCLRRRYSNKGIVACVINALRTVRQ